MKKLIKDIKSAHAHTHTHTYPMKCGLPEIEHFDEANSPALNPTVETNRETFHIGGPPEKQGDKHADVNRAPRTLISACLSFLCAGHCTR